MEQGLQMPMVPMYQVKHGIVMQDGRDMVQRNKTQKPCRNSIPSVRRSSHGVEQASWVGQPENRRAQRRRGKCLLPSHTFTDFWGKQVSKGWGGLGWGEFLCISPIF